MKRLDRIVAFARQGPAPYVDVGADHAYVARALGGIAVERLPGRRAGNDVRWVIADGLRPFREVGTAIIAGMGADRIADILANGPRAHRIVVHAPEDPHRLRVHLADLGWRIVAEALAHEGRAFAEIIAAVPGKEPTSGARLRVGPFLITGADPLFEAWRAHGIAVRADLLEHVRTAKPVRAQHLIEELALLRARSG